MPSSTPSLLPRASVAARVHGARGRTTDELRRFLWTRGLLLVALELSVLRIAWLLEPRPAYLHAQVLWALGWAMVALAGLVSLPRWAVAAIGAVLVVGHRLFDHCARAEAFDAWRLLHPTPGTVFDAYTLAPWIGVLSLGYGLGPVLARLRRSAAAFRR